MCIRDSFYPDSLGFDNKPLYVIDAAKVAALSPFKTSKFQPSAAAIHPKLQKLYILSSASNQLAVTDLNGVVESVHKLSPKLFPQAEGITSVSYTHLRAHETVLDLVCRLLLEKKNNKHHLILIIIITFSQSQHT